MSDEQSDTKTSQENHQYYQREDSMQAVWSW